MSATQDNTASQPAKQTGTLASHRVLVFAGADAASFLQGYLTSDTEHLQESLAAPAAFTNLKGRVVANGWVWGNSALVQMLVAQSLTDTISDFLKPYLNFSKTKLQVTEQAPVVALHSTDAAGIALGADRKLLSQEPEGLPDLSTEWLEHCIMSNEAVVTATTSGTYLPQMLGLTDLGAVSFEKGCYLGQEVVARAQHRGEVKRRLRRASYRAATALQSADVLLDGDGKRVGNVVCATDAAVLLVSALDDLGQEEWVCEGATIALEFG